MMTSLNFTSSLGTQKAERQYHEVDITILPRHADNDDRLDDCDRDKGGRYVKFVHTA
jgi:hypothetical protein